MSQNTDILNHLRKQPITALEALSKHGCICLAERIRDLRAMGHNIITETVRNNGKRFARYILVKEKK